MIYFDLMVMEMVLFPRWFDYSTQWHGHSDVFLEHQFDFNLVFSTFDHVLHHFYIKFIKYCLWLILMIFISSFSLDLWCSPLLFSLNMPMISFKCILPLDRDLWLGSFSFSNDLFSYLAFNLDHLQYLSWKKLLHNMNPCLQHD